MAAENSKTRFTFKYNERLHHQKDFQRVFRFGRKLAHPAILIYIYHHSDEPPACRLGLITSRKLGKACIRNRLKRRLREIFRLNKHLIKPGFDIIFIPLVGCADLNYNQLQSIIISLFKRAQII